MKKVIIFAVSLLILLGPVSVFAEQASFYNCQIENIPGNQTGSRVCALKEKYENTNPICNGQAVGKEQTCCCAKEFSCNWRWQENDFTTNVCQGDEIIGTECEAYTKPSEWTHDYITCCCPKPEATTVYKTADFIMPEFQVPIDTIKLSAAKCSGEDKNSGRCEIPWIAEYIQGIYQYGLGVGGILAAIVLMAGGLIWLVSAGDASKITQAKDLIFGSITGLIILLGTYLILDQINPNLTALRPISIQMIEKQSLTKEAEVSGPVDIADNPYRSGCEAARSGDLSVCQNYGENAPEGLTELPGSSLKASADIAEKYSQAMECVREKNNGNDLFGVESAWRSAKRQLELKEQYGDRAATPCCSNHGKGIALDIKRLDGNKMDWDYNKSSGLETCMNNQGLYANLENEAWHWSPSGR